MIAADPDQELGPGVAGRFGRLPFLLKVLAAARPLSLQVHPSAEQAEAGFRREEAQGPDRAAADRLYRDDLPKPEIACAVTPFEAVSGFRPVQDSLAVLRGLADRAHGPWAAELAGLADRLGRSPSSDGDVRGDAVRTDAVGGDGPDARRIRAVVRRLLGLSGPAAAAVATTVRGAASTGLSDPGAAPSLRDACELVDGVGQQYPHDAELVLLPLLHHLRLKPGQALFTPAGVLHSYLSGTVVELMAASDNVLRGGLTSKHVDVDELMAVLDTAPHRPAPVSWPRSRCPMPSGPTRRPPRSSPCRG